MIRSKTSRTLRHSLELAPMHVGLFKFCRTFRQNFPQYIHVPEAIRRGTKDAQLFSHYELPCCAACGQCKCPQSEKLLSVHLLAYMRTDKRVKSITSYTLINIVFIQFSLQACLGCIVQLFSMYGLAIRFPVDTACAVAYMGCPMGAVKLVGAGAATTELM